MTINRFAPLERRRHPRTQLRMTLHGIRMDPEGDLRETLEMTDISRGGLGVMSDRWLYPGQRIVLVLPVHPHGRRRNLHATVVRCQREGEGFRVGLEFDAVALASTGGNTLAAAA